MVPEECMRQVKKVRRHQALAVTMKILLRITVLARLDFPQRKYTEIPIIQALFGQACICAGNKIFFELNKKTSVFSKCGCF